MNKSQGTLPNYFLKISIIMTLSRGPVPLASWQKQLIGIPELKDSGRYTCRTFLQPKSVIYTEIMCSYMQTQAQGLLKGWFEVHAKISVMALTPSPFSVTMMFIFKKQFGSVPLDRHTSTKCAPHSRFSVYPHLNLLQAYQQSLQMSQAARHVVMDHSLFVCCFQSRNCTHSL